MFQAVLKKFNLLIAFLVLAGSTFAQIQGDDCSDAIALCPGNAVHLNNFNATTEVCSGCADGNLAVGTFCYEVNNSVWMSFTTNAVGGAAAIDVSGITCLSAAGMDSELELSVLSATIPCNSSTYAIVNCTSTSFSGSTTVNLTGLLPNTTYYIQLDGDDVGTAITQAAQCEFDIEISGEAVEPQFNTTVTNASCAGADGQIVVNSVTGLTGTVTYSLNGGAPQASNTFSGLNAGEYSLTVVSDQGCTFNEIIDVPLTGGPQDGTAVVTNAGCGAADGSITLSGVTGGTAPYTYSINSGAPQASNVFSGLFAGTYSVTVTDDNGCSFTYENISVAVTGSISTAVLNVVQPTCDSPTGSITVVPVGGATPYTYSINGSAPVASNVFSGLDPGNYLILIFDNSGCIYSVNVTIENFETNLVPQIFISPSIVSVCDGTPVTFSAFYSNGGSAPVLQWQINGVNAGSSDATFSSSSLSNGDVVTCTLVSNDPCVSTVNATSNSAAVTVIPQVNPVNTLSTPTTDVCSGDPVVFTSTVTGCSTGGTYYWIVNGSVVDSSTTNTFTTSFGANASVSSTFSCDDPCSNLALSTPVDLNVTSVIVDAGPNQEIGIGESTILEATASGSVTWTPSSSLDDPNSLTPIASPTQTTTYTVTVTNGNCTASDQVTVVVTELIVAPNTFTPNDDGINDVWHIAYIEKFPSCKVTVYDRWGQKVYNSTGYSNENPWDGKFLGVPLPASTYYYVIELNGTNNKDADVYEGWVAIIY